MSDTGQRLRRPTQTDVARRAGLSQAVVSNVISGTTRRVAEPTRRRVLEAVEALGYVPNSGARALRLNRTMTLAMVIPDVSNPFYPAVARGVQDRAEASGYQVIIYNTDGVATKERRALASIQEGRADGAIIWAYHLDDADYAQLIDAGIPVVTTATVNEPRSLPIDHVVVDVLGGVTKVVAHFRKRGFRPIAAIAGPQDDRFGRTRKAAFLEAFASIYPDEKPARVIEAKDWTRIEGYAAMEAVLRWRPRPRAIFAANDLLAIGALECCKAARVDVPERIAIAGFDDIEASSLVTPALTTVARPKRDLGEQAASLLIDRIRRGRGGPVRATYVPLDLVVRQSA